MGGERSDDNRQPARRGSRIRPSSVRVLRYCTEEDFGLQCGGALLLGEEARRLIADRHSLRSSLLKQLQERRVEVLESRKQLLHRREGSEEFLARRRVEKGATSRYRLVRLLDALILRRDDSPTLDPFRGLLRVQGFSGRDAAQDSRRG